MSQRNLESESFFCSLGYCGLRNEVGYQRNREEVCEYSEGANVLSDNDGEEGRPNQDGLVNLAKLYFILRSLNCLKGLKQTLHDLIYGFHVFNVF